MANIRIIPITDLEPIDISALLIESQQAGFNFVAKLAQAHRQGSNRFNKSGECLLGAFNASGPLIAIGGLNQDPYANQPHIGRLRHFYVLAAHRQQGIGSRLLEALTTAASGHFDELVLRTPGTTASALFYQQHGFIPTSSPHHSHRKTLT